MHSLACINIEFKTHCWSLFNQVPTSDIYWSVWWQSIAWL